MPNPSSLSSLSPPPLLLRSFVLHDVQGLYGGQVLWAKDQETVVQVVTNSPPDSGSSLWERRYQVQLTPDRWQEVERLADAHHFLALPSSSRPGLPDEGRPCITLVTNTGATIIVQRWAGDHHPDFDALHRHLLGLCCQVAKEKIVHEGPYDWIWRPAGFDPVQ